MIYYQKTKQNKIRTTSYNKIIEIKLKCQPVQGYYIPTDLRVVFTFIFEHLFLFAQLWYQVFLSNTNNLHTVVWLLSRLGCIIHRLLFCRGVSPRTEYPGYDIKQSDGEAPVMLELWGIPSIPSLPLLLGQLWPGVVALDRVLSMGQIELNCVLVLNWIAWNRTVLISKLLTYARQNCLK